MLPWKIHPSLSESYLVRVADMLRRARDSAARDAKWGSGDTLWSIGCTAYERSKYALAMAAKDEYADWLSIAPDDRHLIVKINMIPLRFYRGFEDQPVPTRYAHATASEKRDLQTAFEMAEMALPPGHMRIEVSTTTKGFATSITFYQVDESGERIDGTAWKIPRVDGRRKRTPRPVVESLKGRKLHPKISGE